MGGIPVSEKYRGIKNDGIIYRGLAKHRGIPSGGTDFQQAFILLIYYISFIVFYNMRFYDMHCPGCKVTKRPV